jgi:hypothetical protein
MEYSAGRWSSCVGGTPVGRPRPNLPHVTRRDADVGHTWRSCGSSGNRVDSPNRYAETDDLGDETGEHFGARIGAEMFPNGAG